MIIEAFPYFRTCFLGILHLFDISKLSYLQRATVGREKWQLVFTKLNPFGSAFHIHRHRSGAGNFRRASITDSCVRAAFKGEGDSDVRILKYVLQYCLQLVWLCNNHFQLKITIKQPNSKTLVSKVFVCK